MAVDVAGGILKQSDVRETITNTEETNVNWELDYARFEQLIDTGFAIEGIFVSPDGLHAYITYDTGGASTIGEYVFGTRWDISTITVVRTLDVDARDTAIRGIFFKADGTKMYFSGNANVSVYEYDLATPWDISTETYVRTYAAGAGEVPCIFFRDDGKEMFLARPTSNSIKTFRLSTAWDISTGTLVEDTGVAHPVEAFFFSKNGLKLYVAYESAIISEYVLTKPFVVSSKGAESLFTITPDGNVAGLYFKPNGSKMYVATFDTHDIQEYSIKRGWR